MEPCRLGGRSGTHRQPLGSLGFSARGGLSTADKTFGDGRAAYIVARRLRGSSALKGESHAYSVAA
jgi:hypothetical protein